MSEKETKGQKAADLEKANQEAVEPKTESQEITGQKAVDSEAIAQEATEEAPKAPEPTAIGDEKIAILKHDIYRKGGDDTTEAISIELAVKNVSDTVIGSALFEAELYDIEGNILDKVEEKITELKPGLSRTVRISYSQPKSDKVKSYCVRVIKTTMPPELKAIGNEKVKILKHGIITQEVDDSRVHIGGVDIAIRNVSDVTIASVVFEAVFYDIEGNVMDTVKRVEAELKPNFSRAVAIHFSQQDVYHIRGYDVRIVRMKTVDAEKVQLRRHEIKTTDDGQEEVGGIVKNISGVKTDAALVATFYDSKKENIGTRVVILRDIEPGSLRQFHFMFKPIEGDIIRTYNLNIGDIVESVESIK